MGVVFQSPSSNPFRFSFAMDYWSIAVDNTIGTITIPQLLANINAFPERIERTNGIITGVDLRTGNFGSRRTQGVDFAVRASWDGLGGIFNAGLDGTYLLEKREKLLPNLPYSDILGVFTFTGDLGLRWKHNAYIGWRNDRLEFHVHADFPERLQELRLPASATRPIIIAGERLSSTICRSAIPLRTPCQADRGRREPLRRTVIRPSRSPMTAIPAPAAPGSRASRIRAAARSPCGGGQSF